MADTRTLFLAWQDTRSKDGGSAPSRAWFPIGRLDAEPTDRLYKFGYTHGALRAQKEAGFQPLDAFPKLEQVYKSEELFPLFRNRLISPKREDYPEYVERLGLGRGEANPFEILAISGGTRQTDSLEVFPMLKQRRDGGFNCRFFLHGWRHVNVPSQERLARLHSGEKLQVSMELNNPATGVALQLQTADDYFVVGWAPRYLVTDLLAAIVDCPSCVLAHVLRFNAPPAPHNQRVLVEMSGRFGENFEPMSSEDYKLIAA